MLQDKAIQRTCGEAKEEKEATFNVIKVNGKYKIKAIQRTCGEGLNNCYYDLNDDISLLSLDDDNLVLIIDKKWVKSLKHLHVSYRRKRNGNLDAYCKMKCTDGKNHYIPVGKIVHDLASGKISDLSKDMIYNYDHEECHHKKARIDNRGDSVESLTNEVHKNKHMNENGGNHKSHDKKKIILKKIENLESNNCKTCVYIDNTDEFLRYILS